MFSEFKRQAILYGSQAGRQDKCILFCLFIFFFLFNCFNSIHFSLFCFYRNFHIFYIKFSTYTLLYILHPFEFTSFFSDFHIFLPFFIWFWFFRIKSQSYKIYWIHNFNIRELFSQIPFCFIFYSLYCLKYLFSIFL